MRHTTRTTRLKLGRDSLDAALACTNTRVHVYAVSRLPHLVRAFAVSRLPHLVRMYAVSRLPHLVRMYAVSRLPHLNSS
jgi:hypothetical protein